MANDHKNDGSFEDTDFEDLDPIEDDDLGDDISAGDSFADDAWEDDEIKEMADDNTPETDDDIAVNDISAASEKTFVQKNFAVIVGAVVVIFGGVIGLSMMGGNSAPPAAESETADALPAADISNPTEFADSGEMPPMPAPINSEGRESAIPSQEGALTPMPMPGEADDTQLAALTIEEVPAAPAGKTTPEGQAPFDFSSQEQDVALKEAPSSEPQLPPAGEAETKELTPAQKASLMMNERFRERAGIASESVNNKTRSQLAEKKEAPEEQDVPAPALQAVPQSTSPSELTALQEQLSTQQAQSEKSIQDLKVALEKKNSEITALQKSIKTLENDLSTARAEAKSAKTAAMVQPTAMQPEVPQPESISEDDTDSEAAKIVESFSPPEVNTESASTNEPKELIPASPAVKAISWELKGASPGKAVLFSKTTGDTRNVAIGETVQGLGKITIIARENGRWIVRGTQGQVTR